jgi:hypothetical protein
MTTAKSFHKGDAHMDPLLDLSVVVITDVDTVAQVSGPFMADSLLLSLSTCKVLKLSLRELPIPLFTFEAFDAFMALTRLLEVRNDNCKYI